MIHSLSPSLFLFSFSLVHFLIPYLAVQFLSPSPTHLHYLTQSVSFSLLHTARWIVFGKMTSPVYYQGKSPPSDSFTLLDIISLKCLQHAKRYFHIRCCDSFFSPSLLNLICLTVIHLAIFYISQKAVTMLLTVLPTG